MIAQVCRDQDRECGDMQRSWCATCPKRVARVAAAQEAPICQACNDARVIGTPGMKCPFCQLAALSAAPAPTEQAELPPADFEQWAATKYPLALQNHSLGGYARSMKQCAKEGWDAALDARQAPTAAPKEATVLSADEIEEVTGRICRYSSERVDFNTLRDEITAVLKSRPLARPAPDGVDARDAARWRHARGNFAGPIADALHCCTDAIEPTIDTIIKETPHAQ